MEPKYLGKNFLEQNYIAYKGISCITGDIIIYNIGILESQKHAIALTSTLTALLDTDTENINITVVSENKFISSDPSIFELGNGTANIIILKDEIYYILTAYHVYEEVSPNFFYDRPHLIRLEIDRQKKFYLDPDNDFALIPLILTPALIDVIKNLKPTELATLNCKDEVSVYGARSVRVSSKIQLIDVELMVEGRYFKNFKGINSEINSDSGIQTIDQGDSGSAVFNNNLSFEGLLVALNVSKATAAIAWGATVPPTTNAFTISPGGARKTPRF